MDQRDERIENTDREILRKYDVKAVIRITVPKILLFLCGYFASLGELPFGARPFGVALLAATGRGTPFVYIGATVSAFVSFELEEALVYFGIYTLLLFMRVFLMLTVKAEKLSQGKNVGYSLAKRIFCERNGLRVITSATVGVALGAAVFFSSGLLYYDLFGLLLLSLTSPVLTAILCGYFNPNNVGGKKGKKEISSLGYELGFLCLCAICVFGGAKINFYGVSLSVFSALMLTFFTVSYKGVGYGAFLGLALGLCYSPMLAPLFVIAALCTGIFVRFSAPLACFATFFSSCAWAFYVEGLSVLSGVFGGILSACLVYSVAHKIIFCDFLGKTKNTKEKNQSKDPEKSRRALECTVLDESVLDGIRLYETNLRMSAVSDALYKLSSLFEELEKEKSELEEYNKFYDEKYNNFNSNDLSAPDYRALSSLLAKALESEEKEYTVDKELSKRLCFVLSELNMNISGVLVYGVRKKTIYIKARSLENLEMNAKEIAAALSPVLPFIIDCERFEIRRDGERSAVLVIREREKISASVVRRCVLAKNEKVCGDSIAVFKNDEGRFFALISDGMGTGVAAHSVSQICSGFVFNMLSVGCVNDELLSMLNGFLSGRYKNRMGECSATLDLLEVDLMNGKTRLFKCGAAPSYVYRKGRLFKLRSGTMPIGILTEVDVKCYNIGLCKGDIVIMVSDGVTGEAGECPWLFDLLSQNLPNRSPERISELIVKYATSKGSTDDISALVIRVE